MADVRRILNIEVPLAVRLAEKSMAVREVLDLAPGSVIQFETSCETPLQLLANDRVIAGGKAVKIAEHFGLQVTEVARPAERINALR